MVPESFWAFLDLGFYIVSTSRRHHYIPQFFIEGFGSAEGIYWVYDKKEERIKKYTSAKQIFFDWDRYTLDASITSRTTVLEDVFYKRLDSDCSRVVSRLQSEAYAHELLNYDNVAVLNLFIITLFCRSPKYEDDINRLIRRGTLTMHDNNGSLITDEKILQKYKTNPSFVKLQMFFLIDEIIKRNAISGKGHGIYSRLIEFSENDFFLLGDYPLVYFDDPNRLAEMLTEEVIMPITSKRLYYTVEKDLDMTGSKAIDICILIIDQAVRYVCGPDKEFLEKCVALYREYKKRGWMDRLRYRIFR